VLLIKADVIIRDGGKVALRVSPSDKGEALESSEKREREKSTPEKVGGKKRRKSRRAAAHGCLAAESRGNRKRAKIKSQRVKKITVGWGLI